MDRATAQQIYDAAERELNEKGFSSFETFKTVRATDVDELEYFFMDGPAKMIFNLGRWKRRFLSENKTENC